MFIVKTPVRVSLFGGSTDYKDYYENSGSFLIGSTINKYSYLSVRERPSILSPESVINYSCIEIVNKVENIKNPLIRETLKYKNITTPIELFSYSDIPSRVGLGGSSAFCVGLLYSINRLLNIPFTKKQLVEDAIHIERVILNEAGGIQDQIWAAHGGFNSIEINRDGKISVKPIPITAEFKDEFQDSLLLIYTNDQRNQDVIASSHINKNKSAILDVANTAYTHLINEDVQGVGKLLYQSWKEKSGISPLISTEKIDAYANDIMSLGAYGVKLLGAGGCGFLLVVCDPITKLKIKDRFKTNVLDFKFETQGVTEIFSNV